MAVALWGAGPSLKRMFTLFFVQALPALPATTQSGLERPQICGGSDLPTDLHKAKVDTQGREGKSFDDVENRG